MGGLRDKAAIVGIGQTEFSSRSGRSETRMVLEAIKAALEDAGLRPGQVDGLVRYGVSQPALSETWVAHNLGVPNLRYWASIDFGGSAACAMVGQAAAAVHAGLADYVVCYRSVNGRSERRPGTSDTYQLLKGQDPGFDNFVVPHGLTAPTQIYAMIARRHMHEYGTTKDQMGAIAVNFRANANRTPGAHMKDRPLSLADYHASPVISSPLQLYDCCLQTDGAVAIVVCSAERARDLRARPVYVKGAVQATMPEPQGPLHSLVVRPDITESSAQAAARRLYAESGIGPGDIDVAQIYDCFTITVLLQLEAYGFCGRGESGAFVGDGHVALGGSLPVNTAGGNLSEGYLHGVNHILEGVRQVRGTSATQVAGVDTCLVTAGMPLPTSALILGGVAG